MTARYIDARAFMANMFIHSFAFARVKEVRDTPKRHDNQGHLRGKAFLIDPDLEYDQCEDPLNPSVSVLRSLRNPSEDAQHDGRPYEPAQVRPRYAAAPTLAQYAADARIQVGFHTKHVKADGMFVGPVFVEGASAHHLIPQVQPSDVLIGSLQKSLNPKFQDPFFLTSWCLGGRKAWRLVRILLRGMGTYGLWSMEDMRPFLQQSFTCRGRDDLWALAVILLFGQFEALYNDDVKLHCSPTDFLRATQDRLPQHELQLDIEEFLKSREATEQANAPSVAPQITSLTHHDNTTTDLTTTTTTVTTTGLASLSCPAVQETPPPNNTNFHDASPVFLATESPGSPKHEISETNSDILQILQQKQQLQPTKAYEPSTPPLTAETTRETNQSRKSDSPSSSPLFSASTPPLLGESPQYTPVTPPLNLGE